MLLPLRESLMATVMGVALATATPSKAQDTPPLKNEPTNADLLKEINSLKNELDSIKRLQNALDETVLGRKDGKVLVPSDKGLFRLMSDLEKSVSELEKRVKKLEDGVTEKKSTSAASPVPNTPITGAKGTLKLVNEYATPVSLIVNGTSYPLDPQQTKEVEIPAGSFSYELLGTTDAKRSSTIKEGETVTLRIR